MQNEESIKYLIDDEDGMMTYDYIVNNIDDCHILMPKLIANLKRVDRTGQFLASTARYLHAIDAEGFSSLVCELVELTIEKDREHRYLGSLLEALWGNDYQQRSEELEKEDDNFRRIYKRLFKGSYHGI